MSTTPIPIQTMRDLLETRMSPSFVANALATYEVPLALLWYLRGPIVTVRPKMLHLLPAWIPRVVYTQRFDVLIEEHTSQEIGALATDADVLVYLLSTISHEPLSAKWAAPYGQLAERVMHECGLQQQTQPPPPVEPEPDHLHQLRLDLRQTIIKAAREQEITKPLLPSQLAPPSAGPTFQQMVGHPTLQEVTL